MTDKELEVIANTVAMLSRHEYWNKELWRKLKDRKKEDKAEVQNAFLTLRLKSIGIHSSPCGMSWVNIWEDEDKHFSDEYLDQFKDIFEDYNNWCKKQR